ncbi:Mak10 domain containing protein [Trichuris trichiura]|uniref:Protein MAK10 homolog n=1 Tax=Trichuris trichiura TaxID=36087 RepID=A0A077ZIZ0_TRITR|nr:Mak10 domain containing protein [Trichuris trichiura]
MDVTTITLVAWLKGCGALESLFTNLYLQEPWKIEEMGLRTFCTLIRKLVNLVSSIVQRANIYEESSEEHHFMISPMTVELGSFPMHNEMPNSKLLSSLEAVEKRLMTKSQAEAVIGYVNRLSFYRHLYVALLAMTEKDEEKWASKKDMVIGDVTEIRRSLFACQRCLEHLYTSKEDERMPSPPDLSAYNFISPCESSMKVGNNMFSSLVEFGSLADAGKYLRRMVGLLLSVVSISDKKGNYLITMKQFIKFVDYPLNEQPCLLTRSVMQLFYYPGGALEVPLIPFAESVRLAMEKLCMPPYLPKNATTMEDTDLSRAFAVLMNSSYKVLPDVLRTYGLSSSRRLFHIQRLLPLLGELIVQSDLVDRKISANVVEVVVRRRNLRTQTGLGNMACFYVYLLLENVREYIFLSLSMRIYEYFELPVVYWYLTDVVLRWHLEVMQRCEGFVDTFNVVCTSTRDKNDRRLQKMRAKLRGPSSRDVELRMMQAFIFIFRAYYQISLCLRCYGLLPQDKATFEHNEAFCARIFCRFEALTKLPFPFFFDYKVFLASSTRLCCEVNHTNLHQVVRMAVKCLNTACNVLSNPVLTGETVAMLRVICRKNMIAAQLLMKESKNVRLQGFRMDDDFHAVFPLISVETVRESGADETPANLNDQTPTVYERLDNNLNDESAAVEVENSNRQVNGEAAAPEAERDEEAFVPV